MNQLNEFENWANSIITELAKPERSEKKIRNISLSDDPAQQARIKYPGLDSDEALSKFIADKLVDMEKRDLEQNKIINAQSKANNSLKSELGQLVKNFQDVEQDNIETHKELDRIKALSGQLKADKETSKLKSDEVAQILAQVKELQNKPGMTDEHYNELKKQVDDFKKTGVDPKQLEQFKSRLEQLSQERYVDSGEFAKLQQLASEVSKEQETRKIQAGELKNLTDMVKELQSKKGVTPDQVEGIKEIINQYKDSFIDPLAFKELSDTINQLNSQRQVDTEELNKLSQLAKNVETGQATLEKGRQDLNAKVADLERRQAEVEQREKAHDKEVNDKIAAEREKRLDAERRYKGRAEDTKKRVDKIEPRVDAIEPEISKIENKIEPEIIKQDYINDEQTLEIQRQKAANDIQDKLLSKIVSGDTSDQSRVNTKPVNIDAPAADRLQDRYDNRLIKHSYSYPMPRTYEFKTELSIRNKRISNLLANVKPDGNQKTKKERESGVKKAQIEIQKLVNDLESYLTNEYADLRPDDVRRIENNMLDSIKFYSHYWSKISGKDPDFFTKNIKFNKSASRADKINQQIPNDGLKFGHEKERNAIHSKRLPEGTEKEIKNLAENILGPEYNKYLK
jgi:DNA repair exonuclease SbcCD ATPase subunit